MANSINSQYKYIIKQLKMQPGLKETREILNYSLKINPNDNILTFRHLSLKYILAETIWYFSGSQSSSWIGMFANMWNNITDDGIISNSAYGHILFKRYGFNQIEKIIEMLKKDPYSRRAFANINIPHKNKNTTKDEPCTIGLQFYIRDNKLYATGIMRSNDIYFGLPYDIIFFTELQKYIARQLEIDTGDYTHFVVSLHMYINDETKIDNILLNYENNNKKTYKIDFEKLINQSKELYKIVNKENIIKICKERNII